MFVTTLLACCQEGLPGRAPPGVHARSRGGPALNRPLNIRCACAGPRAGEGRRWQWQRKKEERLRTYILLRAGQCVQMHAFERVFSSKGAWILGGKTPRNLSQTRSSCRNQPGRLTRLEAHCSQGCGTSVVWCPVARWEWTPLLGEALEVGPRGWASMLCGLETAWRH